MELTHTHDDGMICEYKPAINGWIIVRFPRTLDPDAVGSLHLPCPMPPTWEALRIEALQRHGARMQWGHAGRHHGHYTAKQIAAGAPDCPQELHHHHDAFCEEPTSYELFRTGIEKPAEGWHSRA